MDVIRIFSFLGAIIIGLLSLWLFGTIGGLLGAVVGWFVGSHVPRWLG